MKLKDNYAQVDELWSMKRLISEDSIRTEYTWVKEHVFENKSRKSVHFKSYKITKWINWLRRC